MLGSWFAESRPERLCPRGRHNRHRLIGNVEFLDFHRIHIFNEDSYFSRRPRIFCDEFYHKTKSRDIVDDVFKSLLRIGARAAVSRTLHALEQKQAKFHEAAPNKRRGRLLLALGSGGLLLVANTSELAPIDCVLVTGDQEAKRPHSQQDHC